MGAVWSDSFEQWVVNELKAGYKKLFFGTGGKNKIMGNSWGNKGERAVGRSDEQTRETRRQVKDENIDGTPKEK